jgi:hypothetical protein
VWAKGLVEKYETRKSSGEQPLIGVEHKLMLLDKPSILLLDKPFIQCSLLTSKISGFLSTAANNYHTFLSILLCGREA